MTLSQVCATVYTYAGGAVVNKMCMDSDTCLADQGQNSQTCRSYINEPKCTYCCSTPLCNWHTNWNSLGKFWNTSPYSLPMYSSTAVGERSPCERYRCYNGLVCVENATAPNGYQCEGTCNAGYFGSDCRTS
jgi:hypothetical protein